VRVELVWVPSVQAAVPGFKRHMSLWRTQLSRMLWLDFLIIADTRDLERYEHLARMLRGWVR
jgi:hypothetical protein